MAWRKQIRKAFFRGVPFGVTGDDAEAGRRTVVHEFPQREDVYVEDLGAATNRFTVQAFVVGPDYMDARDALEKALREPGPGTLAHPWYGEIQVSQYAPYKVRHTAQDGGMAVFTLSFARDSDPGAPSAGVNARIGALSAAGLAGDLACSVFDAAFRLRDMSSVVMDAAFASVSDAVGDLLTDMGMAPDIGEFLDIGSAYDLLDMASAGLYLWGVFESVASASGLSDAGRARGWTTAASRRGNPPSPFNPGSTRAVIAGNAAAVTDLTRALGVVEASRVLAETVPESRSEARELREGYVDSLDAALPSMPDALFIQCADARAKTLAALAIAARGAPDVIQRSPVAVLPSLAVSYAFSGPGYSESDLVLRNRVTHPGFVPVTPLEVLVNA
jgi:prophage DNA circulation protein